VPPTDACSGRQEASSEKAARRAGIEAEVQQETNLQASRRVETSPEEGRRDCPAQEGEPGPRREVPE